MPEFTQELNAAALALERAKIVVTVSHRRPDGDTIGSALSLAALWKKREKPSAVFALTWCRRRLFRFWERGSLFPTRPFLTAPIRFWYWIQATCVCRDRARTVGLAEKTARREHRSPRR